jgi:hypothetical protein
MSRWRKSSRCESASCVEVRLVKGDNVRWRKSSRCESSMCVEVAIDKLGGSTVYVRSSNSPGTRVLVFNIDEWQAFIEAAKLGEFDVDALSVDE